MPPANLLQGLIERLMRPDPPMESEANTAAAGPGAFPADARNAEGAAAYAMPPRHALAQVAVTGCLRGTFYTTADEERAAVLGLCDQVEPAFIARAALHARRTGHRKALPALLCAVLARRDGAMLEAIFPRVIDSPKMLRTFVQAVRDGATGRRSFGTRPRRLVRNWLAARSDEALLTGSVGARPSLADILRMTHPRPATPTRRALHAWLLGAAHDANDLPACVRELESFRRDPSGEVPDVPLALLTSAPLQPHHWARIAEQVSWQTLRMNLNTFARHGVFASPEAVARVAARLRDADAIARARVLPYQLLLAHRECAATVPAEILAALEAALDLSLRNVPELPGALVVCPDLSSSMQAPITGDGPVASRTTCVQVAALATAAWMRRQPGVRALPFASALVRVDVHAHQSVPAITHALERLAGGGTNCSAPLRWLNQRREDVDVVVLVSDNESWVDASTMPGTALMQEWNTLRARRPNAKLVCIDLAPNRTLQACGRDDVLNIGGFSDDVFGVIERFVRGSGAPDEWVRRIEQEVL